MSKQLLACFLGRDVMEVWDYLSENHEAVLHNGVLNTILSCPSGPSPEDAAILVVVMRYMREGPFENDSAKAEEMMPLLRRVQVYLDEKIVVEPVFWPSRVRNRAQRAAICETVGDVFALVHDTLIDDFYVTFDKKGSWCGIEANTALTCGIRDHHGQLFSIDIMSKVVWLRSDIHGENEDEGAVFFTLINPPSPEAEALPDEIK